MASASTVHAVIVDLFRARPALVPFLLRLLGIRVPDSGEATIVESTFPVAVPDYHVDLVVDLSETSMAHRMVVLLEVQLAVDDDKPYRWLLYQAAAQDRHRSDVLVLVVAPDLPVATWARRSRPLGPHGTYAPVVLGPAEIPKQSSAEELESVPELAVLSALAHGRERGADEALLVTAAQALLRIRPDQAEMYADLLCSRLGEAMQRALEGVMGINGEPLSEYFRNHYRQGLAEGEAKGLAEGEAKGLAEGEAMGLAEALFGVLEARGIIPTDGDRRLIEGCRDPARLRAWVRRAASVATATMTEVLGEA